MKKCFFLTITTMFLSCNNSAQIKHFNNFDTFKLMPFDSANKTNLSLDCHYENEKLIKIEFNDSNDKTILSSDVIYFNGKQYFITSYKKYYDFVLLSYVKDNIIMNFRFIKEKDSYVTQGFYYLNTKYEKDWRNYNNPINMKKYSSILEFIKNDLNKLTVSMDFQMIENFNYVDDGYFEYDFTQYFSKKADETYNKGYPSCIEKTKSFGGCLFLDSILHEMYYFTDIILIKKGK